MREGVALLLTGSSESSAPSGLNELLEVFGIECGQMTAEKFWASSSNDSARLLCSAATFLELAAALGKVPEASGQWSRRVHSAFVFARNDDPVSFNKLAQLITGDSAASLIAIDSDAEWSVSDKLPELCKSMSGVRVAALKTGAVKALFLDESKSDAAKIISSGNGTAFVRIEFRSVPVFLSTAEVIDVGAPLPARVFDIRMHFLSAVPVVLYLKWALPGICWQPPETPACLVIDDPLLKPRYGYLNFQHLLGLMERLSFSTSIAFIPWNWNRSSPKTVRLFQENPSRFSLSIHGCDHTAGEYGGHSCEQLAWKSRQAIDRMERHRSKTGLSYDHVMVFPQGVFSEAAMGVLKGSKFIGVVNSEVISTDPQPRTINVNDCWDVAVMSYSDFPIFTRRYPWAGIENFAFDILLGKPCIVVVHHNDCRDDCRHVAGFIERLNKLNVQLRWTSLAEVIRRGFRQRELSPGVMEVEIYGSEVRIENLSDQKRIFRFRKRESTPLAIREVRVAAQPVKWNVVGNRVEFETELNPGESKTVAVTFNGLAGDGFQRESLRYRAKAMLRRYLCEVRDNYKIRRSFPH